MLHLDYGHNLVLWDSWNGWIYFHVTDMEKIEKAKEDV